MTGIAATVLEAFENDDLDWELALWDMDDDGPFDLIAVTALAFTIKEDKDATTILQTGTATVSGDPTAGIVTLTGATPVAEPCTLTWRLRVTAGGRTRTVAAGPLVILNA